MKNRKLRYINNYVFPVELLLVVFMCLLTVCCERKQTKQVLSSKSENLTSENAVNINIADISDLEKLPSIGPKRARQIVEFREKFGKFLKTEQLILVDGMSDAKFRQIRHLVKVD